MKSIRLMILVAALALLGALAGGCAEDEDDFGTGATNQPPVIDTLYASPRAISADSTTTLTVLAHDPDNDSLLYEWSSEAGGGFPQGNDSSVTVWQAPLLADQARYFIRVSVSDSNIAPNGELVSVERLLEIEVNRRPGETSGPSPSDSSAQVSVTPTLSWNGVADPEGDEIVYNVYLGVEGGDLELDPVATGLTETEYEVTTPLNHATTYIWQVGVEDEEGYEVLSDEWIFSTTWDLGVPPPSPADSTFWETVIGLEGAQDTLRMVWVPADSFMMGADPDDPDADTLAEGPRHKVVFDGGFWMSVREVTAGEFLAVLETTEHIDTLDRYDAVDRVSWEQANLFANTLNAHETGSPWRLPSEAEWEFAARAGVDTSRFPWGDSYDSLDVWRERPNPFGLLDMYGGLFEWVEDDWHYSYYGAPTDGDAWVDNPRTLDRVVRGGASGSAGTRTRPAFRDHDPADEASSNRGFRVVRSGS